jgi:hypothetical protein
MIELEGNYKIINIKKLNRFVGEIETSSLRVSVQYIKYNEICDNRSATCNFVSGHQRGEQLDEHPAVIFDRGSFGREDQLKFYLDSTPNGGRSSWLWQKFRRTVRVSSKS